MNDEIERVLSGLEARFEAALEVQEEEAAADLAASFEQDAGTLGAAACSRPAWLLAPDSARLDVSAVGVDYFAVGEPVWQVRRMSRAIVALGELGTPPVARSDNLAEVLKRWCRDDRLVEVGMPDRSATGNLVRVGADHLLLRTGRMDVLIPLEIVEWVRRARGG